MGVLWLLGMTSFMFGLVAAVASEIPELDPAKQRPSVNGVVYANDGRTVLAVLRGDESRVLVKGDEIAPIMKQAIVAVEDRRFFEHRGIDLRGIARALWADIREKRVVEGGSTITQQFVKNALRDDEKTIGRKVREAALAWQLEQRTENKEDILTAYLNTIYFGNGAYGIQQAARVYFDKSAKALELHEAALLAGIPADPSSYDPVANPSRSAARRDLVLRAMLDQGDIGRVDYELARQAPLPRPSEVRLPGTQGKAPYFANYVKEQLVDRYGASRVFGGGLRVQTTIDLGLQELARTAVAEWLPEEEEDPAAALVALDPETGNVLAMVGGRNYRQSQFNLAVQSERQPGSAFKPFVLAAALEQGISPATTLESKPVSIPLGDRYWMVENHEDVYLGRVDLETATVHSDNAVYAQLARLLRPKRIADTARKLGIQSPLENYFSIALGAQAVNPLELARAYAAFANGGYRVDTEVPRRPELGNRPRVIEAVLGGDGRVSDWNRPLKKQVLSARTAAYVNLMLQKTIEQGTGRRALLDGWPAAGKTGTTENYGDAWFVGYTPQLVVAVWVGYPTELRPMLTEFEGEPVSGGTFPALIWKSFMEQALPYLEKEPVPFAPPPSLYAAGRLVVERDGEVQLDNGLCRERVEIVYFAGFGPRKTADCRENEVEVPDVRGRRLAAARERLEAQPLTPAVDYRDAKPGEPVGVVVEQRPATGRLSAFDEVTVVVSKAPHGVVPDVRGVPVNVARERLRKAQLRAEVRGYVDGPPGMVVSQTPKPGVAAGPELVVELAVARG
ncbi:MAG TPA: PBP1A family penicillin-binding protein [Gaiellaceae bacterium]|nr:PBP1A family penicillin-binding protein [Gaiellaceae bacterium]